MIDRTEIERRFAAFGFGPNAPVIAVAEELVWEAVADNKEVTSCSIRSSLEWQKAHGIQVQRAKEAEQQAIDAMRGLDGERRKVRLYALANEEYQNRAIEAELRFAALRGIMHVARCKCLHGWDEDSGGNKFSDDEIDPACAAARTREGKEDAT